MKPTIDDWVALIAIAAFSIALAAGVIFGP